MIEEEELARRKSKQLDQLNAEADAEKERNIRLLELEADRYKEQRFRGTKTTTYEYRSTYNGESLPNYALEEDPDVFGNTIASRSNFGGIGEVRTSQHTQHTNGNVDRKSSVVPSPAAQEENHPLDESHAEMTEIGIT